MKNIDDASTVKLRPSAIKWILIGSMFLALAGLFAFMYAYAPVHDPPDDSKVVFGSFVAFFLLGAAVSFAMLLPGRNYLLLGRDGFTVKTLWGSKSFRWGEVEHFGTLSVKGTTHVTYALSSEGRLRYTESWFRKLNRAVSGGDDNLPDTYGLSAEELAELMNQWKKRSTGAVQ